MLAPLSAKVRFPGSSRAVAKGGSEDRRLSWISFLNSVHLSSSTPALLGVVCVYMHTSVFLN